VEEPGRGGGEGLGDLVVQLIREQLCDDWSGMGCMMRRESCEEI